MLPSEQQRDHRRKQRSLKRFRDERDTAIRRNLQEVNERVARFRQNMLQLYRRASSGNPARAVSSAVSSPSHMCEALLFVLSSLFQRNTIDTERIHFRILNSTLIIEKVNSTGYDANVFQVVPRIEVTIGTLQRASLGHGSDHDCPGLCCDDDRHGMTRIICPVRFNMEQQIVSTRVECQKVLENGNVEFSQCYIKHFHPYLHRNSSWKNRVSGLEAGVNGVQDYIVRYLDNEVSGLPDVIVALLRDLF